MAMATPTLVGSTRSWKSKVLLLAGSTLSVLLVLELAFRVHDVLLFNRPFLWDPAAMVKKDTELCNPFLLFRGGKQDWQTRCKTPDQVIQPDGRQVFRIVCLGGSTTQDVTAYVREGITYPTELQRVLNDALGSSSDIVVETINAGFASHATLHMLILLETELLDLKPDLLIVYENINDLTANYFPGPTTPAYANKFLNPYYLPPELRATRVTLLDHSRFYTWARDRLTTVVGYGLEYSDDIIELKYAEVYHRNLRNIAAVAKAHRIPVMFGQQAMASRKDLFEVHFRSKSYNDLVRYPRIEQLRQHFERYNAIVREVAAEHEALCADPYSRLKDRPELFLDNVHLVPAGSRLVGQEFARVLLDSGKFHSLLDHKRRRASPSEDWLSLLPN